LAGTLLVLCQAHPEYGRLSLLREYRRDVRRYLFGQTTADYPTMPVGYLGAAGVDALERFAALAAAGQLGPEELWRRFPFEAAADSIVNSWGDASAVLYANWLAVARERNEHFANACGRVSGALSQRRATSRRGDAAPFRAAWSRKLRQKTVRTG